MKAAHAAVVVRADAALSDLDLLFDRADGRGGPGVRGITKTAVRRISISTSFACGPATDSGQ